MNLTDISDDALILWDCFFHSDISIFNTGGFGEDTYLTARASAALQELVDHGLVELFEDDALLFDKKAIYRRSVINAGADVDREIDRRRNASPFKFQRTISLTRESWIRHVMFDKPEGVFQTFESGKRIPPSDIRDLSDDALSLWGFHFPAPDVRFRFGGSASELDITSRGKRALAELVEFGAVIPAGRNLIHKDEFVYRTSNLIIPDKEIERRAQMSGMTSSKWIQMIRNSRVQDFSAYRCLSEERDLSVEQADDILSDYNELKQATKEMIDAMDADMKANPDRILPFDAALLDRVKALVSDVDVDLDEPLTPDIDADHLNDFGL